ncbi:hypothetical protein IFM89_031772 [Coptis chinensis]|uniref:Uncharacterized protein n=1 Tax=Coptis chinensis TaxID=261450 RepID=A0A835LCA5_9MAGN|nr:hypothetical protein IFM89_031772 [Coptis chinensis]
MRISDLKGTGFDFPQLSTMKSMKTLDLSFNNLIGEIPTSFANLVKVDFIYLTRNMLTGAIPAWVLGRNRNVGRST